MLRTFHAPLDSLWLVNRKTEFPCGHGKILGMNNVIHHKYWVRGYDSTNNSRKKYLH